MRKRVDEADGGERKREFGGFRRGSVLILKILIGSSDDVDL